MANSQYQTIFAKIWISNISIVQCIRLHKIYLPISCSVHTFRQTNEFKNQYFPIKIWKTLKNQKTKTQVHSCRKFEKDGIKILTCS